MGRKFRLFSLEASAGGESFDHFSVALRREISAPFGNKNSRNINDFWGSKHRYGQKWHESGLTVVFCALTVSRYLYRATGYSIRRIVHELRPLRDVTININGHELVATTPPGAEAAVILTAVKNYALK